MAISNVVINEGKIIFKRVGGHKHDGLTSSLIDTTKYSMFDFVAAENTNDARRSALQRNNKSILKTLIINTIEERVLNPQGIRIQANAITAREIVSGTITANELTSNIVLVNNVIRSNNYNGTIAANGAITAAGNAGWVITSAGAAEFANTSIRGEMIANSLNIGSGNTSFHVDTTGNLWLGSTTYDAAPFKVSKAGVLAISANTGGTIGGQPIDTIAEAVVDFNSRNNRNGTALGLPTILSDGTAIDHTINTDSSVNISFEWNYAYLDTVNSAYNIDGFYVYMYANPTFSVFTVAPSTPSVGSVTYGTTSAHGLAIGNTVVISGLVPIEYNGTFTVTAVTSTTFRVANSTITTVTESVGSVTGSTAYTFGTNPSLETSYPVDYDQRAVIFTGFPANKYYTFGVKAFRVVDRDIDTDEIIYSSIVKSTRSEENPYLPSATVAFDGNITGTIDGQPASILVAYANAGNTAATNFNANNDRNSGTPTSPVISNDATVIDHVINTDGSADISFEWTYTVSNVYNAANNIDGFIVYTRVSTSGSAYTFGTTPLEETTYYLPREKRAFILPAIAADKYYNFGISAYRMVDTDIAAAGIVYSPIIQSTFTGDNPYRPSTSVAFAGNITGTIDGLSVSTVKNGINNFNNTNDRIADIPNPANTIAFGSDIINTNGTIDIPVAWTYGTSPTSNVGNIDGFILYFRTTPATDTSNISSTDTSTTIQTVFLTPERRAHTFSGVSPNSFYRAAIRPYRIVDADVIPSPPESKENGAIYGSMLNSTQRTATSPTITDGFIAGININGSEIQSNSFSAGTAGFRIGSDGNAEFNNVTVRGTVETAVGLIGGLTIDAFGLYKSVGANTTRLNSYDSSLNLFGVYEDQYASAYIYPGRLNVLNYIGSTTITGQRIDTTEVFTTHVYSANVTGHGMGLGGIAFPARITDGAVIPLSGQGPWPTNLQWTNGGGGRLYYQINDDSNVKGYLTKTEVSDRRLKSNISQEVQDWLSKFNQIKIYEFEYNNLVPQAGGFECVPEQIKKIGVIADEIEQLFPEFVLGTAKEEALIQSLEGKTQEEKEKLIEELDTPETTVKDDGIYSKAEYQQVDYSSFTPLLIATSLDQNKRIKELETRLQALEGV
jgi:hypothetical protein